MSESEAGAPGRRSRRAWTIAEKRRIVELSTEPMASVAEIARAYGLNANQLFKWRRAHERGELSEPGTALIPVTVSSGGDDFSEAAEVRSSSGGAIHIELPGHAVISVERGAEACLVQSILEILRK